ncbi:uncharacterized protein C8R40DRAFT_1074200 [Lentinula edodes]|uniref:uncharacterized protein n=1 Tax=Lentinula edodes TaxID=5353 RepID=UPI001E8E8D68|nr:uncharacterized protein C8R40DRAFT_1074200 [Lentinula edodes]KAH7869247.1 hypothetical protein C8R40DRAFT_1074200 [Lentinula edodes]
MEREQRRRRTLLVAARRPQHRHQMGGVQYARGHGTIVIPPTHPRPNEGRYRLPDGSQMDTQPDLTMKDTICKTWVRIGLRHARSKLELEGSYSNRNQGLGMTYK